MFPLQTVQKYVSLSIRFLFFLTCMYLSYSEIVYSVQFNPIYICWFNNKIIRISGYRPIRIKPVDPVICLANHQNILPEEKSDISRIWNRNDYISEMCSLSCIKGYISCLTEVKCCNITRAQCLWWWKPPLFVIVTIINTQIESSQSVRKRCHITWWKGANVSGVSDASIFRKEIYDVSTTTGCFSETLVHVYKNMALNYIILSIFG